VSGNAKSCGCHRIEGLRQSHTRHGLAQSREYQAWRRAKHRCITPSNQDFKNYGGRGITFCDRWLNSFEAFIADMGKRPSKNHSLDRIDTNGPYAPGNCRWATSTEQANNRRSNATVTLGGIVMTITQAARLHGINPGTAKGRINVHGWTPERAVTTPTQSTPFTKA
jgi:hypothetical protein